MPALITEFYRSDAPLEGLREQHQHNVYQILYVTRGYVKLEITGTSVYCKAPGMIFISNYEPHMITAASSDYERYVLALTPQAVNEKIAPPILQTILSIHPVGFPHSMDLTPIDDEIRAIYKMLDGEWGSEDGNTEEGIRIWLCALLHRLYRFSPRYFSRTSSSAEKIVAAVREEIEKNPGGKLSLDTLAASHFISRYYMAHIFKDVTGYSIKEYLLMCRISLAGEKLTMTDDPIFKISQECGFPDMSNFSRYFRKVTGITPTAYRKSRTKAVTDDDPIRSDKLP